MSRALVLLLLAAAACSFPEYAVQEPAAVETCRDGLRNHGEVDVDCGVACNAPCSVGQSCATDAECQTGLCQDDRCATPSMVDPGPDPEAPSCNNGLRDGTETDLDCGGIGGCSPCATGKRCETDYDCNLARCNAGFCLAQSCGDGLQNQDESDVDCGGSSGCDRCFTKQHCTSTSDCLDSKCSQGLCQAQGCDDGVENGVETDMDCGGSCIPCADNLRCELASDCLSESCDPLTRTCTPTACDDGIVNGDETAVDCGGACTNQGKGCALMKACVLDRDCQSGKCSYQRCMPASVTGEALPRTGWAAAASGSFNQSVPSKVLDGNPGTFWESGALQKPNFWFQLDMLEARPFFSVEVECMSNDDYPRDLRLLISEDGQTFVAATGAVSGDNFTRFDFPNGLIARYIKLELMDDANFWWRIDEMRVKR